MMQQVTRFVAEVEGKISHWIVESDTTLDAAERMCLQFLQQLGKIKEQQAAMTAAQAPTAVPVEAPLESKVETFTEQPHVES